MKDDARNHEREEHCVSQQNTVCLTAVVDAKERVTKIFALTETEPRIRSRPARNVVGYLTYPTSSILPWRALFYNEQKLFFNLPPVLHYTVNSQITSCL
jgi:hypothetical protein